MFRDCSLILFNLCFILLLHLFSQSILAGTYKEVTDFGENPSKIQMFLYTPDFIAEKPAILVACHWCHGKAQDIYNGSRYVSFADKFGYYVIFPSAISSDGCWDVASDAALKHNGGGDPLGIVSMVRYVIKNFNADSTKVYVLGVSSGAMMTNVLLGAYPDVFAAGAAFAGVPFGCFAGPNSWNDDCAKGRITRTAQEWGELVRAAYPGYTGRRPKIQMWHGTNDDVLNFHNLGEALKQWTNVHGIDTIPSTRENNVFQSGWTRQRYKNDKGTVVIETVIEQGQPHNLQVLQEEALAFLGLDQPATGVRSESTLINNFLSNKPVITYSKQPGTVNVLMNCSPGVVSLILYTVNGQKVYSSCKTYSSEGIHRIILNKKGILHKQKNYQLYIMKISVDGVSKGAYKVRF